MIGEATTSAFGRRGVTRAQIEAQLAVGQALKGAESRAGASAPDRGGAGAVHKWTVLRMLSEIRDQLGVSDRALSLLSALLSFHPETALSLEEGDGLVVFPSNKALALRCNGMSEPTLRRHLSALVEAGLIIRRDSPNGKRFARRAGDGHRSGQGGDPAIVQAFGFDLSPLAARAGEFEARLEEQRGEQRRARLLKERINLLRRDLTKRIAFALDEGLRGPWQGLRESFLALCTPLRKLRTLADFTHLAGDLDALQGRVSAALEQALAAQESPIPAQNPSGDGAQFERPITESNPHQFLDPEPASNEAGGQIGSSPALVQRSSEKSEPTSLPLALVLDACPDIRDYDFSGQKLDSWRAFADVAATVRPMLGVSPDAWREALDTLGEKGAATALAFILQRCEHSSEAARHVGPDGKTTVTVNGSPAIRSPGGYLRALTQEARKEPLNLWGAILGLLSQRGKAGSGAGRA